MITTGYAPRLGPSTDTNQRDHLEYTLVGPYGFQQDVAKPGIDVDLVTAFMNSMRLAAQEAQRRMAAVFAFYTEENQHHG